MKVHLTLLGFVLCAAVFGLAQAPSGNAGAAPANAQTAPGNSGDASASASGPTNQNDSMLQSQVENALRNEPALSGSHIVVAVSAEGISLSGTVASGKDKLTAERIAQSFDGNRKMNDTLMITGQKPVNGQAGSRANNPPNTPPQR